MKNLILDNGQIFTWLSMKTKRPISELCNKSQRMLNRPISELCNKYQRMLNRPISELCNKYQQILNRPILNDR